MTPVVEKLLAKVQALPAGRGQEASQALLQRAKTEPQELPDDADLLTVADALFQELDGREQSR